MPLPVDPAPVSSTRLKADRLLADLFAAIDNLKPAFERQRADTVESALVLAALCGGLEAGFSAARSAFYDRAIPAAADTGSAA